ncbi:MAG TPA: hypothetical protein VJ809_03600 [Pirellulales bacterium]|nr:hypothetical protein [Pirellulales bacterium]
MTAALVKVADDVTAALNGQTFVPSFTAVRSYADDEMELTEPGALRVDVVVVGHDEAELSSRGVVRFQSGIDIGVRFKFGKDEQGSDGKIDKAEIDKLVELSESIYLFLARQRLDLAVWQDAAFRSSYVRKHLREWRQFTCIIRVRFDTHHQLP